MSRCPACGGREPGESHCRHCHVDMRLPAWKEYWPAYLRIRFLAAILDHIPILLFLNWATPFAVKWLKLLAPQVQALIWQSLFQATVFLAYFFVWTAWTGTTPGKWLCKLRVLDANTGEAPGPWRAFVREVPGRFLCAFLLSPIGYITVKMRHSRGQTLADLVARTVVVRPRKRSRNPKP